MPQDKNELLRELIDKYARMYMKLAYNRGVPYDDVEDVVMDAFWAFSRMEQFGTLDDKGNRLVLARIVRNKCTDYYRKYGRVELIGIEDCAVELDRMSSRSGNGPEDLIIADERRRQIRKVIDELKDIWRDPVRMYYLEGRTMAEISEALGISEMLCRSRISRAKKHLETRLRDLWEQS